MAVLDSLRVALSCEDSQERMEVERGTHAVPTLSRSELDTLLAEVPAAPDGLRFAALCELLFVSGLRISEALSLQMSDLEVIGDILMVRVPSVEGCKTGFRPVPVPIDDTPLAHALDAWLAVRYAGPWVFSTYNGTPMHRNSFSRALNGYAGKSGLSKRVHPHLFRHSAATNWLAAGMPELYVQQMLGHKSLEMTSQYSAQNVAGIVEWMRR